LTAGQQTPIFTDKGTAHTMPSMTNSMLLLAISGTTAANPTNLYTRGTYTPLVIGYY
jgi:hypothetical protein